MFKRLFLLALPLAMWLPVPAGAAKSPQDYRNAGILFFLPAEAAAPLDADVIDETGRSRNLRSLIARPAVLVFADYTCTTLCGPIVAFVASALENPACSPGEHFSSSWSGSIRRIPPPTP